MSHLKKDRVFQVFAEPENEARLAQMVASALRHDCAGIASPIKYLARLTGCHLRAIKNWYEGRHVPSSHHLLALAAVSPSVWRIVLEHVGGGAFLQAFESAAIKHFPQLELGKNVSINVRINGDTVDYNPRQKWFLNNLRRGFKTTARSIELQFNVSLKTAQRDISALKKKGIIAFRGSQKTGCYELLNKS